MLTERQAARRVWSYYHLIRHVRADGVTWSEIGKLLFPHPADRECRSWAQPLHRAIARILGAQRCGHVHFDLPNPPDPPPASWPRQRNQRREMPRDIRHRHTIH